MRFVTEPESKKVRVSAIFNEEDYTVKSSTDYDLDFASGFDVDAGTIHYALALVVGVLMSEDRKRVIKETK